MTELRVFNHINYLLYTVSIQKHVFNNIIRVLCKNYILDMMSNLLRINKSHKDA